MSISSSNDTKDEHGSSEQSAHFEQGETGHSGEGSASALAHMISQGQQHRHQTGGPGDAAGTHRQ